MKTFGSVKEAGDILDRPAVVIGNFDGVHLGHQDLLLRLRDKAKGRPLAVLTFEPHPVEFFKPKGEPFRLTSSAQRERYLIEAGADAVITEKFHRELANMSPRDFFVQNLVVHLKASAVMVGEDFRFGRGRSGDLSLMEELAQEMDIDVHGMSLTKSGSEVISSSRIRIAVQEGDVGRAASMLGRPFCVDGVVVHGDARGRKLGFPTANIEVGKRLLPAHGIYAATLQTADRVYEAAAYIGYRPTFGDGPLRVEAFVLDAPDELDLYEQPVELAFYARAREDRAFSSADNLAQQMEQDVETVRAILRDLS